MAISIPLIITIATFATELLKTIRELATKDGRKKRKLRKTALKSEIVNLNVSK